MDQRDEMNKKGKKYQNEENRLPDSPGVLQTCDVILLSSPDHAHEHALDPNAWWTINHPDGTTPWREEQEPCLWLYISLPDDYSSKASNYLTVKRHDGKTYLMHTELGKEIPQLIATNWTNGAIENVFPDNLEGHQAACKRKRKGSGPLADWLQGWTEDSEDSWNGKALQQRGSGWRFSRLRLSGARDLGSICSRSIGGLLLMQTARRDAPDAVPHFPLSCRLSRLRCSGDRTLRRWKCSTFSVNSNSLFFPSSPISKESLFFSCSLL